jgi:Fe-S cluster assembly protein SufD
MVQILQDETMNGSDAYRESFKPFESNGSHPAWLLPLRRKGLESFEQQGFPSTQEEDWRYTNVAPIAGRPFKPVLKTADDGLANSTLDRSPFRNLSSTRLVFLDGHYSARLSSMGRLPAGVQVSSLAAALRENPERIEKHLGRHAALPSNPFAALNQAFFQDGGFIHVPAGIATGDPIQLVFIASGKQSGAAVHPRNLILAEAQSKVSIIETYLGAARTEYLTNAVTEIVAADQSQVELIKFQDESMDAFHIATLQGEFSRGSNVSMHSFALGARLSRNNIRTRLAGEGLECILNGLYITRDEQLADHHMVVEHAEAHCASHEYFNGILDDKSRGVFHGRIFVHQMAQKTDAKQTNKNLLLSDDATVNTKPQLEIYADDVKCTHGATVGQLDEEAIYYLRSRGLGLETARRMLIHAFAGEIIERVRSEPVREELDGIIWDRLEANPHLEQK